MYTIYAIKSEKKRTIYVGFTNNLERRLSEHKKGKTRSTKDYNPFKLIYTEEVQERKNARKREKYLKSGCSKEFLKSLCTRSSAG